MQRRRSEAILFSICLTWLVSPISADVGRAQASPPPGSVDAYVAESPNREALEEKVAAWNRTSRIDFDAEAAEAVVDETLSLEYEWLVDERDQPRRLDRAVPAAFERYLEVLAATEEPEDLESVATLESLLAEELGRGGFFAIKRNKYSYLEVTVAPSHCGSTTVVDDDVLDPVPCAGEAARVRRVVTTPGDHRVVVERGSHPDCMDRVSVAESRTERVTCQFPD